LPGTKREVAKIMKTELQSESFSAAGLGRVLFLFAGAGIVLCSGAHETWAAPATTTTTLAVSSAEGAVTTVTSGSVVTLTATVEAGTAAVRLGTVNFCDAAAKFCTDIHMLGTAQLTSAGTAVLRFIPGIGSHTFKAVFLGTQSEAASTSIASALDVTGPYLTATTIAQSVVAGSYRLTATVVGTGGMASPAGTVSFLDLSNGNHELAAADLGEGKAGLKWANSSNPATGPGPYSVAVGDFNGDGISDLAISNYDDGFVSSVTVLLGNGNGKFTQAAQSPITVGGGPISVAVGDLNGDGIPDLAVANNAGGGTVTILLGNGNGTFTQAANSPVTVGIAPISVAVGDFNRDGIPDLAVANQTSQTVTILLGNGNGTFTQAANSPATGGDPYSVAVGDFNEDGIPDLAVANMADGTVTILLGIGDGTFTQAANSPVAVGERPSSVTVGDFNEDGVPDLAIANSGAGTVTILLGNGDGKFTQAAKSPVTVGSAPFSVVVGDFNEDGIPDLAVADSAGSKVAILLGNVDGTFLQAPNSPVTPGLAFSVAVGVFNEDGIPDLVAPNYLDDRVSVLLTRLTQTANATASKIPMRGVGGHKVEASYPGDDKYLSSVSKPTILAPTPLASLSATSLAFGNQKLGKGSRQKTVTLTNIGNAALAISSVTLRGRNASSFLVSDRCGKSLAEGAVCNIDLQFDPKAVGAVKAVVAIKDNAGGSPQSILLTGTGRGPVVALSATSVRFGHEGVGVKSPVHTVSLTNGGNAELTISSIALTGANASSFLFADTCGKSLAAGAVCSIKLHFDPKAVGTAKAVVAIKDNAGGSPQLIELSGTGTETTTDTIQ
jgi:hypothetical protein